MSKNTTKNEQETTEATQQVTKPKRGRPRKYAVPVEKKTKLTLAEKQAEKLKIQKERQAKRAEPKNKERFYCTNKELQEELIKWRDSAEKPEDRILSEELGKMLLAVGNKILNRSEFRNYPKELKEDMLSMGLYKLIKGLKNYNFAFNNPFSYCTQTFWNAYLTIITKHYRQLNIKKDLMAKLSQELETYTGISPTSSLNKCLKSYLGSEYGED